MIPTLRFRTAGLACCHGQITLACMTHLRHRFRLDHLVSDTLPDSPETRIDTIRSLVTLAGCRGWPTAIALPVEQTIRRQIRMAASLRPAERDAELHDHLADYLPGSDQMLCIDHAVLQTGAKENDILLVAAAETTIREAVSMTENAGLVVRIVDVDLYAKARALALQPLQQIPAAKTVNTQPLSNPTPAILTAIGLALRQCPAW